MKLTITRWDNGAELYSAEAESTGQLLHLAISDSTALLRANLYGANLEVANLYGANLRGANLYGANLEVANLEGANLKGANLEVANLYGANLYGANLYGANLYGANLERANLYGANLERANLYGANLYGANLYGATKIDTGESWATYLKEVVPALLTAGGKTLAEVLAPCHWECHSWDNCPLAAAFSTKEIGGVPVLLKPRAEQFIRYFDAKLIPMESVGK